MKKILFLFVIFLMVTSCGESRKEKIERKTAKILVTYNDAINSYKRAVAKQEQVFQFWSNYGRAGANALRTLSGNWKQHCWDTTRVYFKIDSLENDFLKEFGEDEYNILRLKLDDNFNKKMR